MKKLILSIAFLMALCGSAGNASFYWQTRSATKGSCTAIEWQNANGDIARKIECKNGKVWRAIYWDTGQTDFNLNGLVAFYSN